MQRVFIRIRLGAGVAPITDFFQTFAPGLLKQPDAMPGMFKLVNVRPDFCPKRLLMDCRLAATGATGMQLARGPADGLRWLVQFDKNAPDLLDIIVIPDDVLVTQQEVESQFSGLHLRFGAGVKRTILCAQLLGGIARHPESFLVSHSYLAIRACETTGAPRCLKPSASGKCNWLSSLDQFTLPVL